MSAIVGTIRWSAPESFQEGFRYSEKSDVFSFGIVLWEIIARQVPFKGMKATQVITEMVEHQARPPIPIECDNDFEKLICQCWHVSPNVRPNFKEIHNIISDILDRVKNESLF